jgi:antitoxin (DNA-binding transcriptional repressor) of toxin-antitoxin stability system
MQVNLSEFGNDLVNYLKCAGMGEELLIISQGEVIARVLPPLNEKENARAELMKLRQKCRIGDVISPIGDVWNENL